MSKARYIMIGGFLGAGKTTAVAHFAQHLTAQGRKVGLITNDQGNGLVDTAMLRARGFATEEIPGGCFCCRFNSLMEAAGKLTDKTKPDVFIAEPVGSCTDLVATVSYPLRRIYGENFEVAPLSVLLDPVRAARIFGLEAGGKFSEKVLYIYRKQLEEADVLAVNKTDLLDEKHRDQLRAVLAAEFPGKQIIFVSARTGFGMEKWLEAVCMTEQPFGEAMPVDYEVYAEGEALLGWLNATVQVSSGASFDGNLLVRELAERVQTELNRKGAEVGHLKMTFSPDEGLGDIAVVNLVRNDFVPELSSSLADPTDGGQLIVNLRAEAAPEVLKAAVENAAREVAAARPGVSLKMEHLEHFRPGKPQPTHRMAALLAAH